MKKFFTLLCGMALAASASAQNEAGTTMIVTLSNGNTSEFSLTDIKNITFKGSDTTTPPSTGDDDVTAGVYSIAVPTDFSTCRVQKVMYNGKQIAEIDQEYIKSIDAQKVVVYPMGEDGKADLTKGVSATDGGTVVWDMSANTATYTAGEAESALTTVYLVADTIATSTTATDIKETTVEPDYLVDNRNGETNTYTIVKIGTQYWMAENLRATKYANGKAITYCTTSDTDAWELESTGAYHIYGDNKDALSTYGALYNGYAVTSEDGLAPEGWEIPTKAQWIKVRSAGNFLAANFKVNDSFVWPSSAGNNITGFSATPCGYYTKATLDTGDTSDAWWWTSTTYYDILTKSTGLEYARINVAAKNMTYSNNNPHSFDFGHSVRCVRK
jgi:uncharacterized protein (TIGR02145 family)